MNTRTGFVLTLLAGVLAGQVFFSSARAQQPDAPLAGSPTTLSAPAGDFISGLHARLVSDGVESVLMEVPAGKAFLLQHVWIPDYGNTTASFTIDRGKKNQRVISLSAKAQRWEWKGPGFRIEPGESLIVKSHGSAEWLGYSGFLIDA